MGTTVMMATLIIEWCKESGNPEPVWEVRTQSVITVFLPSSFFSTGRRPEEQVVEISESRPESRPESLEDLILNFLQKGPLSKAEISRNLGHRHISGGLKKAICNLLGKGMITYTIPEKSNSRLQKYKLKKN